MLGCIVATLGSFLIGAVWYDYRLPVGRVWMSRTYPGKAVDDVEKQLRPAMGITAVSSFMLNLLLRFILVDFFHVKSILDAVKFTVGLCCLSTLSEVPHCLFGSGSVDAFLIDRMYDLMNLVLSGVCIAYFN